MTDNPFFKPENPKASQQVALFVTEEGHTGNVFGHKIFRGTCSILICRKMRDKKGALHMGESSIFANPNNTVVPLLRILKNLQNVP